MNKVIDWIKRHQITAFIIITFTITWGLGFSYIGFYKGKFMLLPLGFIATCGPALAGIIISAVCNTQPRQGSSKSAWIAFLVAWIVSTMVWLAHRKIIEHLPISPVLVVLILVSVVPVPFVISMAYSRIPAVKSYLTSLIRLRGVWGWSLLALVLFPALVLLSIPISNILGQQPIAARLLPETGLSLIGVIAGKFLYQFFFFNAIGEEVGWRGFALPRLQARTNPLIASLILACFWIPWHFVLWKSQGQSFKTWGFWMNNFLIILSSIIHTWFYNRSQGSILVAGILHAAGNTNARVLLIQNWNFYFILMAVVALVMILADRMWRKLTTDHPAVVQPPVLDG
jgi:membrane protease YdiL (CAAX protease family)